MARHTKEYNEGYQAAIEAIKQAMQGGQNGQGGGQSGQEDGLPSDMTPPPGQGGGSGGGSSSGQQGQQSQGQSGGGSGGSRTDANNPNQGIVRPEDCAGSQGVGDMPSTPGGFFSKEDGDKLAQAEGYEKEGGTAGNVEKDWSEAAQKAASQLKEGKPGDAAGRLKSTIEGLYKVSKDWKKDLKYVVGKSINPEDKRQAYANKNILVSQDRIARTDKDKYDNMDYMIACIDTSGSMTDEQLKILLSEVYAVALAKKPIKLYVIYCDTEIQEITEFKSIPQLKKEISNANVKGRGGTDMKALWNLLKTDRRFKGKPADLTMIFTDIDSRHRQYPRDTRQMGNLVWCILDDPGFTLKHPDRMTKIIHIKSSDIK